MPDSNNGSAVTPLDEGHPRPGGGIRWFAVVLLVGYVALLAIGTASLWVVAGGGPVSWAVAGVFAVLYVAGWRVWLAPASHRRLAFRERLTVHLVAGTIVVVLGSLANVWLPAIVALSALVMGDALNERDRGTSTLESPRDLI